MKYASAGAFRTALEQRLLNASLSEVRPRLHAVIPTATGKLTEAPLGIVIPWDLLEVARNLQS